MDRVVELCGRAVPLLWMTMTMTRWGETGEQLQETDEQHSLASLAVKTKKT